MLRNIAKTLARQLTDAGIDAVTAFDGSVLNESSAFVCVAVESARISSAGLGGYIGICTENGEIKEMYGDRAELVLALDVYAPTSAYEKCDELSEKVRSAIVGVPSLTVSELTAAGVGYDEASSMLRARCTAKCSAYIVRRKCGSGLADYELEGCE